MEVFLNSSSRKTIVIPLNNRNDIWKSARDKCQIYWQQDVDESFKRKWLTSINICTS